MRRATATGMAAATELLREQKLEEAVAHLRALFAEFMDKPEVRQLFEMEDFACSKAVDDAFELGKRLK